MILIVIVLIAVLLFAAVVAHSIPATVEAFYTGQASIILAEGRAAAMQTQANGEWWLSVTPLIAIVLILAMIGATLFVIAYNRKSDNDTRIILAFIDRGYTPFEIYSERYRALPEPQNHPIFADYKQLESRVTK